MRSWILAALFASAASVPGYAAQSTSTIQNLQISASSVTLEKDGSVTRLRGKVVVKMEGLILEADEVDLREDTGVLEARGNVSVRANSIGAAQPMDLKILDMRRQLAELQTTFTPDHYKVQQVERQIAELETARSRGGEGASWSFQSDAVKMQIPRATR